MMKIDQANSRLPGSHQVVLEESNILQSYKPFGFSGSIARPALLGGLPLVLVGSLMQGYANGTFDAVIVALCLFVLGCAAAFVVFNGKKCEISAFLLTFSICIIAGGLAQCYSLAVFNNPQSTIDAVRAFFPYIASEPPFTTMESMPHHNSPLAIVIWQQLYKVTWWFGLDFGPYVGVMLNSMVMGLTASITVRTARELFGDDPWRLQRVGVLFAFCGLFVLFGAVMIRDCFTTFFNSIFLWGIIRWLCHPDIRNFFYLTILAGISAYAITLLRFDTVLLFGLYLILMIMAWTLLRRDFLRAITLVFTTCVLIVMVPYVVNYMKISIDSQENSLLAYQEHVALTHAEDSLGMKFVVDQPLPVRLVLGSGSMMISPIPVWANFNLNSNDSQWLKGYNGFYQIFLLPLVFTGLIGVFQLVRYEGFGSSSIPLSFISMYLLLNMLAVVATSLEQRHVAQFLPALMILAAVPDTRDIKTRKEVGKITKWWFIVVALVHLVWAVIKG